MRINKRIAGFIALLGFLAGCERNATSTEGVESERTKRPIVPALTNCQTSVVSAQKTFEKPARRKLNPEKSLKGMKPAVLRFALKGAMDKDNPKLVFGLAAKAANSEDVELRDLAVDALNWYGADAIPELLPFMLDTDQQIINKAFDAVDLALANVPDEFQRMELLAVALDHASDEDQARSLLSKCETVSPIAGIGVLIDLIEKRPDSVLADLCREEYEDLAGRPYRNRDEAERMARYLKRSE